MSVIIDILIAKYKSPRSVVYNLFLLLLNILIKYVFTCIAVESVMTSEYLPVAVTVAQEHLLPSEFA